MEVSVEILSLSGVFPIRVEMKVDESTIPTILFVDVPNKKVYTTSGYPANDDIADAVLKKIGNPTPVKIPDEIQAAMSKYREMQSIADKEKNAREN